MIPDWLILIIVLFLIWKIVEVFIAKWIAEKVMNHITEHNIKLDKGETKL